MAMTGSANAVSLSAFGKTYSSIKAFSDAFGLRYVSVQYHLRAGRSPEEIVQKLGSLPTTARYKSDSVAAYKCSYDGVEYPSISVAAEALGISSQKIYALKNHSNYSVDGAIAHVMELERELGQDATPRKHQRIRPCVVDGVTYRNQSEALKVYGMQYITVKSRMNREGISFEEAITRGSKERRGIAPVSSQWWPFKLIPTKGPGAPKSAMGQLCSMLDGCSYQPKCFTNKEKTMGVISFEEGLRAIGERTTFYLLFPYSPIGYTIDLEIVVPSLLSLSDISQDTRLQLFEKLNDVNRHYLGAKASIDGDTIFVNWYLQASWAHINIRQTLAFINKFIGTTAAIEDSLTKYLQTLEKPE